MLPSETMTTMADCNTSNDFWRKSLKHVPKIDHSYIYSLAKENLPVIRQGKPKDN